MSVTCKLVPTNLLSWLFVPMDKSTFTVSIIGNYLSVLRKVHVNETRGTLTQHIHGYRILFCIYYSLSLAKWQELTEPSWPFIRVTQAPRFRNSPVWTFHIFKVLSQELVHRKWPLKVKQQLEIALVCALKHRWKGTRISTSTLENLRTHIKGGGDEGKGHWS